MNTDLARQKHYWNSTVDNFQSIYTHRKSGLQNWLDKVFRSDMYERFSYTLSHAEPLTGRSVLDVGCGTGQYAIEFAKNGASRIVGIDIAPNMLETSRKNVQTAGVADRCEFFQSDLLEFNPETQFNVTIGIGLFDYIRDALPVLRKMREVTMDKVIISVPRSNTWRAPVRKLRLAMKGCDVFFYSKSRILDQLKEAGFNKVDIDTVGKLYCITAFVAG